MTEVRIRDRYLAQLYREAYDRHLEGERLGLEQSQRTWPSGAGSVEGARAEVSPLGGVAKFAAEKERG
jgi:hypothetical protein